MGILFKCISQMAQNLNQQTSCRTRHSFNTPPMQHHLFVVGFISIYPFPKAKKPHNSHFPQTLAEWSIILHNWQVCMCLRVVQWKTTFYASNPSSTVLYEKKAMGALIQLHVFGEKSLVECHFSISFANIGVQFLRECFFVCTGPASCCHGMCMGFGFLIIPETFNSKG